MHRLSLALMTLIVAGALAPARANSDSDLREALTIMEQTVKEHPQNAQLQLQLGFIYRKLERGDDAQKAFETAARLDSTMADAWYMLGLIYEKKSLTGQAKSAWQAVLDSAKDQGMKETARKHLHLLDSIKHG